MKGTHADAYTLLHGGSGIWVGSLLVQAAIPKEGKISIENVANWPTIRFTWLTFIVAICLATIVLVFASYYLRELLTFACIVFLLFTISSVQDVHIGAGVFRGIYTGTTIAHNQTIQVIYFPMIFLWTICVACLAVKKWPKREE